MEFNGELVPTSSLSANNNLVQSGSTWDGFSDKFYEYGSEQGRSLAGRAYQEDRSFWGNVKGTYSLAYDMYSDAIGGVSSFGQHFDVPGLFSGETQAAWGQTFDAAAGFYDKLTTSYDYYQSDNDYALGALWGDTGYDLFAGLASGGPLGLRSAFAPKANRINNFGDFKLDTNKIDFDIAQLNLDMEDEEEIPLTEIFDALQIYLGSVYVNDFNQFGRTYQVSAQADAEFRADPSQILQYKVRNARGQMVPLGSVLKVTPTTGPDRVMHYNGYPSAELNGSPAPGYSSDQAQKAIERVLAATLEDGMTYEWTEVTYQQILAGNTMVYVFPLVVLLVFMVLASQYESLRLPLAIILIVPMTILSALIGVWLVGGDNNVFTQIALIVLVALACKNAILMVEFAKEKTDAGQSTLDAILEACRLRLRPILMTSIAFTAGVIPLVMASGAGAEMRETMGVAVFSGMIGVTIFGLLFTPVFYMLVAKNKVEKTSTVTKG